MVRESGNYLLVAKTKFVTNEQCMDQWEEVIKVNSEQQGNHDYLEWFKLLRRYWKLIAENTTISTCLLKLNTRPDKATIIYLHERGYNIHVDTLEDFYASIDNANNKRKNIVNKIRMSEAELAKLENLRKQNGTEGFSFDELMSNLSMALGFVVPDSITLARYNEYIKGSKKSNKPATK